MGPAKVVKFPQKSVDRAWKTTFDSSRAGTSRLGRLILTEKDEDNSDNSDNNTCLISSTSTEDYQKE
jgi:hypothetical protein